MQFTRSMTPRDVRKSSSRRVATSNLNVEAIQEYGLLFVVGCYVVLNGGFMLLRVPPSGLGLPIGQIVLAISLLGCLLDRTILSKMAQCLPIWALSSWWLYGASQVIIGTFTHGFWAIRDAAHVIESLFILAGAMFGLREQYRKRFLHALRAIFGVAGAYAITYPFQGYLTPLSPTVQSLSGYTATIFFWYVNTTSGVMTAIMQKILRAQSGRVFPIVLCALYLAILIVLFQARIVYLQIALVAILLLVFVPHRLKILGLIAAVSVLMLVAVVVSGINVPGRLGSVFSFDFLFNHFAAIWGGGGEEVKNAADGVELRFNWWESVIANLQNPVVAVFGQGFGLPLTPFEGPSGDLVREPHNSIISVIGRLGLIGVALFAYFQFAILTRTLRLIRRAKDRRDAEGLELALTVLTFFGMNWLFAMAEGGFEVSFIAIPYYVLAGSMLGIEYSTRIEQPTRVEPPV